MVWDYTRRPSAMDLLARLLNADYKKKVADVDREYFSTVPGQVWLLQARL